MKAVPGMKSVGESNCAYRPSALLLIVSDGMKLAGIGIVIGLAVAFVLTRVMFSLLLM